MSANLIELLRDARDVVEMAMDTTHFQAQRSRFKEFIDSIDAALAQAEAEQRDVQEFAERIAESQKDIDPEIERALVTRRSDLYLSSQPAAPEVPAGYKLIAREATAQMVRAALRAPAYGHPETATASFPDQFAAAWDAAPEVK